MLTAYGLFFFEDYDPLDNSTWFVLRTRWAYEDVVAKQINGLGNQFRSFCPLHRTDWVNRGRRHERLVPLWTTYVMADWYPRDDPTAWHDVMGIRGVTGILGGEHPFPVPETAIVEWLTLADENGVVPGLDDLIARLKRGYDRGDRVRIEGGSFDGRTGICEWFDASGTQVKINGLLGRDAGVYIPVMSGVRVIGDGIGSIAVAPTARRKRTHRSHRVRGTRFPVPA